MAAAGQSKRPSGVAHRRDQQARDAATQERVTLIALGVLAAVAVLVGAGVVWGIILPPRAHVVTVGNKSFNAQDVETRAEFMVVGHSSAPDDPVTLAVTLLTRDETMLQAGPAEVGEVTADDVTQAIRKQLAPDAPDADFVKAYATFLKASNIDKPTYERMIRAQVIEERLTTKFRGGISDAGPQLHFAGVSSRDQLKLKQFRDVVIGGADFLTTAISMGFAKLPADVDFGWQLPPDSGFLKDVVHVNDVPVGATTEVAPREGGLQFDVYRMIERNEKQTYTDEQKQVLAARQVDAWIAQQREKVKVTEDLSDGERAWILGRVVKAAQRFAEQSPNATAVGPIKGLPAGMSATVVRGGAAK